MKIGILTHYNVYNQGAQLQLAALYHWLEEQGHQPVVLTYEKNFDFMQDERDKNSASLRALPYYLRHYLLEKGPGLTLFNVKKVLTHRKSWKAYAFAPWDDRGLDGVVIGSDEVYSIDVGCNRMMYGHGLGAPAIAYAPSFGITTEETLEAHGCTEIVRSGLASMEWLSARDSHTRDMIRALTGREAPMVCDPVLLYRGQGLAEPVRPVKKPYLLVYAYDRNMTDPEEIRGIRTYARKHGLITVSAGTYHGWCDRNIPCSAGQWYSLFRDAACVVTDTFHGSVVAIKNHRNLAVRIRENLNAFKMRSLLEQTGLEDRQVSAITTEELERVLGTPVDHREVDRRLEEMTRSSEAYLKTALENVYGKR